MAEALDEALGSAPSGELVVGLVGALGADLRLVASTIGSRLQTVFDYQSESISVSELMADLSWDRELDPDHEDERIKVRMDAGRDLNESWAQHFEQRHDAFARLAVLKIDAIRQAANESAGREAEAPLGRFAYILRSFKRPDEIKLLRAIYGDRFVLFGGYAPRNRRRRSLHREVWPTYGVEDERQWHQDPELELDFLMDRDERERGEGGQDVRDTFHLADFFVNDDRDRLGDEVERCLRVLFGDPFITPTKDEIGMAHATVAALRSAEPGRQVGAAVTNVRGDILGVGCNEVPRAGGGQYWPDDVHVPAGAVADGREFLNPKDTNNVQQEEIAEDILASQRSAVADVQQAARTIAEAVGSDAGEDVQAALDALGERVAELGDDRAKQKILASRLGDITEFGRAVHAEMAAITTAGRLGIPLGDATLYSTTFPCHNCARHIIGTGVRRLVYIAPYAKSQAYRLHADSLVVAPETETSVEGKVVFVSFVGVAPRRFSFLFDALQRKDDDGTILHPDPQRAVPRLRDVESVEYGLDELGYHVRETTIVARTREILASADPSIRIDVKEES